MLITWALIKEDIVQEDPMKVYEEVKEKISHLRGYL